MSSRRERSQDNASRYSLSPEREADQYDHQRRPSTAEKRYTPNVRFPEDPAMNYASRSRSHSRQRDSRHERSRQSSRDSRSSSKEKSRDRSRERRRRARRSVDMSKEKDEEEEKPWYKKKTVWTTVATLATVASLAPAIKSSKASAEAAVASQRSARASSKSAKAVQKSAEASIRSADASMRSAIATTNSAIAQGHQDEYGRLVAKPARPAGSMYGSSAGSVASGGSPRRSEGRRGGAPLPIEYGGQSARHVNGGRRQW